MPRVDVTWKPNVFSNENEFHRHVMEELVVSVVDFQEDWYKCNRGPRPSAALLITENGDKITGVVEASHEDAPSCLKEGCMIVNDIPNKELKKKSFHTTVYQSAKPSFEVIEIEHLQPHCVRNIHAEVNALLHAARFGVRTWNGMLYTINKPCYNCMSAIILAGISKVIYAWAAYDEPRTNRLINASQIEVIQIEMEEPEWQNS